jgi:hypothetical protein
LLENRKDWEDELARLLAPALAHASPGCARLRLPGAHASFWGAESDSFEAFARTLWGAGAWLASSTTGVLDGNDLAAFYRTGLVNGTNPAHGESWYPLLRVRQTLVEAAAIAWNIVHARPHLWEPLSSAEREQMLEWIRAAGTIKPYDNNWHLFTVVVQTALKALGGDYERSRLEAALDRVDELYMADGWYDDRHKGTSAPTLDYYNATVFHPYLLFWSQLDGQSEPERAARIVQRTRVFLDQFVHWFAADGSFPCFGRSASYRCALLLAPVMGVASGASPLPPGQVRRLCRLTVRRFLESSGVVDGEGLLTTGFTRPYPPLVERYSGNGSPYWALKAFSVLSLPAESAFWTDDEEPLPIEHADYTIPDGGGCFLVHGTKHDGQIQLINGGSVAAAKKYSNLAYSSHFGYELDRPRDVAEPDPFGDATLTFSRDGTTWYGRRTATSLGVHDDTLLCEATYRCGLRARARVRSAIRFVGDAQLRVHRVESSRPLYAREGGFACRDDVISSGGALSLASGGGATSGIRPLRGYDAAPAPSATGCNVLYPDSAVPLVVATKPQRGIFYLASLAVARPVLLREEEFPDVEHDRLVALVAAVDGAAVTRSRFRPASRR